MATLGELLSSQRKAKRIPLKRAARQLSIKKQHLQALEESDWSVLPESAFIRGFIKNYSTYLGLDEKHALALFRREYDEAKYPQKPPIRQYKKGLMPTTTKIINSTFTVAVIIFIAYLVIQYLSILSAPELKVASPPDDFTTSVPIVVISGQTEKESQLAINGQFVPVDPKGNFSYEHKLKDGQNIIEIIASKRLSPKTKVTKIIRLTR